MYSDKIRAVELGKEGERLVAEYLRSKGNIIIKRNWRSGRYGEIDIIAESKTEIIFVEVKTRTQGAIVSGIEAVDIVKRERLRCAAEMFMKRLGSDLVPRIDVAQVVFYTDINGKKQWKIKYIKNALT